MSWSNSNEKPSFKTIDDLRSKVKVESCQQQNNSDTESEMIPVAAKKPVKKASKKAKKQECDTSSNGCNEGFVKELDLYDLEVISDGNRSQDDMPDSTDLTDVRLVIGEICKTLKVVISKITCLTSVVKDLGLTDIPKHVGKATKEVDKLRDALYSLNIEVPITKQQRKKGK